MKNRQMSCGSQNQIRDSHPSISKDQTTSWSPKIVFFHFDQEMIFITAVAVIWTIGKLRKTHNARKHSRTTPKSGKESFKPKNNEEKRVSLVMFPDWVRVTHSVTSIRYERNFLRDSLREFGVLTIESTSRRDE